MGLAGAGLLGPAIVDLALEGFCAAFGFGGGGVAIRARFGAHSVGSAILVFLMTLSAPFLVDKLNLAIVVEGV